MIIEENKRESGQSELFVRLDTQDALWLLENIAKALRANGHYNFHTYNQVNHSQPIHFIIRDNQLDN